MAKNARKIEIEYHKDDVSFIADVMQWAPIDHIIKKLESGVISSECDEYMFCDLTEHELDELIGFLSNEANHNKKARVADRICEIADSLEVQS